MAINEPEQNDMSVCDFSRVMRCLALFFLCASTVVVFQHSAHAQVLASIVVDADSGKVLHADNANRRVRPASLTKLMTALVALQDLKAGKISLKSFWDISSLAAGQPASRLGLRSGKTISVQATLDALLIASANDAAMVVAQSVAGDLLSFVKRMNDNAAKLGMSRTRFANPSGLPAPHFTTARDMAVLARHIWQTFPKQRKRYAQTGFTYAGRWRGTTNALLGSYKGARGMKTGFTCRAGFHLLGVAERGGRTLIAVVLGARDRNERVRMIRKRLNQAFANKTPSAAIDLAGLANAQGQGGQKPVSTSIIANACLMAKGPRGWNIDVGIERSVKDARKKARAFIRARRKQLRGAREFSLARNVGVELHRAIVTGLKQEQARDVCLQFRKDGGSCIIFGPQVANAQLEETARLHILAKLYKAKQ